jgi:hypothetical protein
VRATNYETSFLCLPGTSSFLSSSSSSSSSSLSSLGSGFHFFEFHNRNFFIEQGRQPCVQAQTSMNRSLYLCPPLTGWPNYIPQAPGSLFIIFYDSQGNGGGSLTRLHARILALFLRSQISPHHCVFKRVRCMKLAVL